MEGIRALPHGGQGFPELLRFRGPAASGTGTLPPVPTLEVNGISINYEEWGDPEAPAVVLLHGFSSDLRMWTATALVIAGDYRVIAPDLRGHGQTSVPTAMEAYTMEAYVEDLRGLLDALDIEVSALVGCNFGGMIAVQAAITLVERFAGVVLSDSSAAFENAAYDERYHAREREIAAQEAMIAQHGSAGAGKRAAANVNDPFLAEGVRKRYERIHADGFLGAARVRRERPDLLGVIGDQLTGPVLICTGDEDPVHCASLLMADQLPAARVVTFRDTGHGIPALAPELFAETVLSFFSDIEEGTPLAGRRTV